MHCSHIDKNLQSTELPQPRRSAIAALALALALVGALALSMGWASAAHAAPAPWYWWVSKIDGQRVCAQYMPTQGWERDDGPFAQAGCKAR